ncbi:ribosome silencing factor [Camelimonas abortus]|uniref:Ribosomal silencing factor RsfS n=1 Tax=Camelimonas abortus TaxID=1017184 RepID=A0ABV7LFT3_9HYPH
MPNQIPEAGQSPAGQPEAGADAALVSLIGVVMRSLDEMKAEDVVELDLRGKTTIADAMVIASGRSNRHVGSIAEKVIGDLKAAGVRDIREEGFPACDWVLIDAGDVIVHVFRPEVRAFYNLEKMWSAAPAGGRGA